MLVCLVLYGFYDVMNGNLLLINVLFLYNVIDRIVWGVCVCWVIYVCVIGNGGFVNILLFWFVFGFLVRLFYCFYLVYFVIMYVYFYLFRILIYFIDFIVVCIIIIKRFELVLKFLLMNVLVLFFKSKMEFYIYLVLFVRNKLIYFI